MNRFPPKNIVFKHIAVLALPVGFFMYWFWLPFSSLYNSDLAVHILMAEDFQWPSNLYYWHQNRLGSFVPMFASFFYWIGFSGFMATAIVQLLIVISIYFLFQHFITSYFGKFAVAIAVFLPIYPFHVQVLVGHPILSQLFFLGFMLTIFASQIAEKKKSFWVPILGFLALWSSELSAIPLILFVIIFRNTLVLLFKNHKTHFLTGVLVGIAWLVIAKATAHADTNYDGFLTSLQSFISVIQSHLIGMFEMLTFKSNKPGNAILVIVLAVQFVALLVLGGKKLLRKRIFMFFILTSFSTYLGVCASNWNAIMERPLHHYTPAYFFFLMSIILGWSYIGRSYAKNLVFLIVGVIQGVVAIWFLSTFNMVLDSRISLRQGKMLIEKLLVDKPNQTYGLIGSYWNTYSVDALSEQLISIPGNGELVRTFKNKEAVFTSKEVIVIKTGWLLELQETLNSHGYLLKKTSPTMRIENIEYAHYTVVRKLPKEKTN